MNEQVCFHQSKDLHELRLRKGWWTLKPWNLL